MTGGQRRIVRTCAGGHVWVEIIVPFRPPSKVTCPQCHESAVTSEWRGRG